MRKLSGVLVGISTNTLIQVCKKSLKTLQIFTISAIVFAAFAVIGKAATFTVTNTTNSGAGSLRQAIIDANGAAGADTIIFAIGPAAFQQISLQSELTITSDMTIDGSNTKNLLLLGTSNVRIFNITNANVQINDLNIWSGQPSAPANGGGLLINGGTTTLNGVSIQFCSAGNGGGIALLAGNLVMQNSTFYGNQSTLQGGGLFVNSANSVATITSSTFVFNNATQNGSSAAVVGGTLNAKNTIFGNGFNNTPGIFGTLNSQGFNIIQNTTGTTITGVTTGNQLNVDPQLLPSQSNGSGTQTCALLSNSPAIDAGDPSLANITDQRKARRNTDGNNNGVAGVDIGAYERQKSNFDLEGDGSSDFATTRVVSGTNLFWFGGTFTFSSIANETETDSKFNTNPNGLTGQQFGLNTDIPVPADYDGDNRVDAAVYRPADGTWYINATNTGFRTFRWGIATDIPVPADYDGDGKTDIAVYRAGVWYIFKSLQGFTGTMSLGSATDKPVPADYDGDLKTDLAVFGSGTWTINRSTLGLTSVQFGLSTDVPVPADYDGNGSDNVAVFRPTTGTWFITRPAGGFDAIPFGNSTDKLVPADYDGDGKIDIAVWRVNTVSGKGDWYVLQSRDGFIINAFGLSTDKPTANSLIIQ